MKLTFLRQIGTALALGLCLPPGTAGAAQTPVDKADPAIVEDQLRADERAAPRPKPTVTIAKPRAGVSDVTHSLVVGAIRVQGATVLPRSSFARVAENYSGRLLGPQGFQALASDVADVARAAGFGLATAWVPQQRVENGILTVILDEGRIDEVEIDGNAALVRNALAPVAVSRPVSTQELERYLLIAGDIAGVRLGKVRLERRGNRNVLVVQASYSRVEGRAYVDNWGSSTIGPIRVRATVDFNGVVSDGDQLMVGGVVTPGQPQEFALFRSTYSLPVGRNGTEVSFGGYYAHSEPGGILSDRDILGESMEVQASVRHPIVRSRSGSLWGSVDLRVRESDQRIDAAKAREDRLTILGGNLFAIHQLPQGRARGRLAISRGLNLFDATRSGDPLRSRRDADGVFSKLEAWAELDQSFSREFSVALQAEAQVANGPLLSSEEMGLGGRSFGRAWDYREFSGDRGVAGSIEMRYDIEGLPHPIWMIQLYGYADAGKVENYRDGFGSGSLASAGAGFRLWLRKGIEAGAEAAFPLTDGWDPRQKRDPRVTFSFGSRF